MSCFEDNRKNILQIYCDGGKVIEVQISFFAHGITYYLAELNDANYHNTYIANDEELYNMIYRTGYLIGASYVLSQNEGEVQVLHKMSKPKEEKVVFITALFYLKHMNTLMLLYCLSKKKCNILLF